MLERLRRGWGMTKASWAMIKLYPKLLLLPLASGIALLALLSVIGTSIYAGSGLFSDEQLQLSTDSETLGFLWYAFFFAIYLVCTFVMIFFNAALVFCALEAFDGREPSLRAGLNKATSRLPQIALWALVATTVGVLLNALQNFLKERLGFLGSILGGIVEFAWAIMTYFVVPVLVVEGLGPLEAVQKSSGVVRRTWGESLVGEGGLGLISFLLLLPVLLLGPFLVGAAGSFGAAGAVPVTILCVGYIVALIVVFTALGTIFRTGAYLYATTGKAPSNMDPALIRSAFRMK